MFGKPRFPLPISDKVQIEFHLDSILRKFGAFPVFDNKTWSLSTCPVARVDPAQESCQQQVLQWVQECLPFATAESQLVVIRDGQQANALSRDPTVIPLFPKETDDLEELIASIAFALSRRFVNEQSQPLLAPVDAVVLAEMIPLYFGLGVFCCNTTLKTVQYSFGESSYARHHTSRNLTARFFGVAQSYMAWSRNESTVRYSREMRPDARVPFQKALTYLRRTGDSLFDPRGVSDVFDPPEISRLIDPLTSASDSAAYAMLQQLICRVHDQRATLQSRDLLNLQPLLPDLLENSDPCLRAITCQLTAILPEVDNGVFQALKNRLADPNSSVREQAARAITQVAQPGQVTQWDFRGLLFDSNPSLVGIAACAIFSLGETAEEFVPELLSVLRRTINRGANAEHLMSLCAALDTVAEDADERLNGYFGSDRETLDLVQAILRQTRETTGFEPEG